MSKKMLQGMIGVIAVLIATVIYESWMLFENRPTVKPDLPDRYYSFVPTDMVIGYELMDIVDSQEKLESIKMNKDIFIGSHTTLSIGSAIEYNNNVITVLDKVLADDWQKIGLDLIDNRDFSKPYEFKAMYLTIFNTPIPARYVVDNNELKDIFTATNIVVLSAKEKSLVSNLLVYQPKQQGFAFIPDKGFELESIDGYYDRRLNVDRFVAQEIERINNEILLAKKNGN
ncbi:MAG: hypothetical protein ACRC0A_01565 [Chitinophagaceae bacterium]